MRCNPGNGFIPASPIFVKNKQVKSLKRASFFTMRQAGFILLLSSFLYACNSIDLYEKSVSIPGHAWKSSYRPVFNFTIKDTTVPYKVFLILRHNERYNFKNIFVNLYIKGPGQDTAVKIQRDLKLATDDKGWLTTGMDDIYEHLLPLAQQNLKAGSYTFTVEQIMREDPLQHVLNAGIRVEKIK
jgi:gliding motility-associated lipoprotein GldH